MSKKKTLTITLIIFSFFNCGTTKQNPKNETMFIGQINLLDLKDEKHTEWFNKNYNTYRLKHNYLEELKKIPKDYTVSIYLGSWCNDSQRQVPRFLKILDSINYNINNLKLFGLDKKKTSPNKVELGKIINYVPTIIIYKKGKEINRIVETPIESLEQDLLKILKNNTYKHTYLD
ncbi:thioredoxin family protein [uncultured Lacinutrix sp.]|uniref:thioredoxin family protein n=1 Tax=uncultured Lacinutrix sp. TaxID=574032 RepID=UPI00262284F2|nr:thioredoxin family protein [uncultured Lacinutrix sp.]